jgi:ribosomal protein S18 acetylase RimI-like enzyme
MPPPLRAASRFGLSYREERDEDYAFVAELYASTREEEVARTGWPKEVRRAFLAQQHEAQHGHYRLARPDAEWLVIERGGERIGRLYLDSSGPTLHVIDISLAPASRGAGIGEAILRDVAVAAMEAGKPVSIHVEKFNPAKRLYLRLGFVDVEDKGIYDLMEWHPARADQ